MRRFVFDADRGVLVPGRAGKRDGKRLCSLAGMGPAFFASGALGYAAQVLADSPIAYWRMGDASGTTMADSTAGAHAGTYSGSPTLGVTGLVTSDSNKAVTFNGSSQHAQAPYFSDLNSSAISTVECIVKPSSLAGAATIISRRGNGSAANFSTQCWALRMDGAGPYNFQILYFYGTGGLVNLVGATALTAGSKYHVVAVVDNTSCRLYVNGALDGTGSNAAVNWNTATPSDVVIAGAYGASASVVERFPGTIDEVALYATALSPSRIGAHYAAV